MALWQISKFRLYYLYRFHQFHRSSSGIYPEKIERIQQRIQQRDRALRKILENQKILSKFVIKALFFIRFIHSKQRSKITSKLTRIKKVSTHFWSMLFSVYFKGTGVFRGYVLGALARKWLNQKNVKNLRDKSRATGNYTFKVFNRNTRRRCEICSKLPIKTPE